MPDASQRLVRLIAPKGTDSANYGTTEYRVADDGTIVVPAEVAKDLVHGAGFALAPVTVQPVQPADAPVDVVAAALETDPEV
jgi:hypothetical protein